MSKISEKFDRSTIALFSKEIDEITKQAVNNNRVFVSIMNPSLFYSWKLKYL